MAEAWRVQHSELAEAWRVQHSEHSKAFIDWQTNVSRFGPLYHCVFARCRRRLGLAILRRRSNGDGQDGSSVARLVVARLADAQESAAAVVTAELVQQL